MSLHLQREIQTLKKQILKIGTIVEEALRKALDSVVRHDLSTAKHVIANDATVDEMEVNLEEECLKVLALYQPVAFDLRLVIAVLKINNDLERIGDLAVNIAERSSYLSTHDAIEVFDFPNMAEKVQTMLRQSLDALINLDSKLAQEVCDADDEVDRLNKVMHEKIQKKIQENVQNLRSYMQLLSMCRYLERIADHATNIAEDVIYMFAGKIVRHPSLKGE